MIIIMAGLPGTGKSFLAGKLAEKLDAAIHTSDKIRKETGNGYGDKEKTAVYYEIARRLKTSQAPFQIVDATCNRKKYRTILSKAARESGQRLVYIELIAPEEVIRKRISQQRKYSDADFDVYKKLKAEFEPLDNFRLILDSSRGDQVEKALEFIFQEKKKHG